MSIYLHIFKITEILQVKGIILFTYQTFIGCLQISEKKSKDESRVAMELRKHYELGKNRADKLAKDKH